MVAHLFGEVDFRGSTIGLYLNQSCPSAIVRREKDSGFLVRQASPRWPRC